MLKKLLYFSIISLIVILFVNISYASDIVSSFNNTTNSNANITISNNQVSNTIDSTTDNTIYSQNTDEQNIVQDIATSYEQEAAITTTEDYESETELSISNMINIILIVVGIVLILLGIAIIIKLK